MARLQAGLQRMRGLLDQLLTRRGRKRVRSERTRGRELASPRSCAA